MSDNTKRWIVSSLVTFFAGFCIAVVPQLNDLTIQSFRDGTLVGLIFAGTRTGVKAVLEAFLAWYQQR